MANALYTAGKVELLSTANLLTATINVYLVSADYTFSAAHSNVSSISAGDRVGPVVMTGKSVSGGNFTGAPTTFSAVSPPPAGVKAVVIAIGSTPLAYLDSFTALSFNGSDILVTWPASILT